MVSRQGEALLIAAQVRVTDFLDLGFNLFGVKVSGLVFKLRSGVAALGCRLEGWVCRYCRGWQSCIGYVL